ncbi:putative phage abortive infection protein [Aliarcobacter cryaerophilus]|uniref:Phage abortive infection protein n=2 Tax=unclassified Arcobacter TaxID=2593671 RepID=A0AA96I8H9_9BACT|nr:putative phage abortive infection protein [Arcobacter sp. AZ-2023]WPD10359.1 putative phage abortive infection protein [Arcobacter sp. DSM 115954]WNL15189.1 putative phage abortive infection protein [Arcobacter sp. AZ-2023]WNL18929.1 putative phage abortive infection protein [Arcobacter sp. AZ-2023]WNL21068.1 putative phage abortive infection protein [Arcobacter sp. AZ-2023]
MEDKKKESLDTTLNECESSNKKIIDFIKDWWLIVVIIFVAILVIMQVKDFYFERQDLCLISQEVESLGQMGDFFGGTLNPILAFLSFCLLLITIKFQSKELNNSTKELAKSSKALEDQSNSLKIQNFETTFFNLLNFHNKIVDNFVLTTNNKQSTENAFQIICLNINKNSKNDDSYFKNFNEIYDEYYKENENILNKYFENIYLIFKFISDTNFDHKEKKKYSDIFRVQFSEYELELLFYHCTSSNGFKKLKPYIEEFNFFEFLILKEENKNFKFIIIKNIYKSNTFGNNYLNIKNVKESIKIYLEKISSEKESLLDPSKYNFDKVMEYCFYLFISEKYDEALEIFKELKEKISNTKNIISHTTNIIRIDNFIRQIKKSN